MSFCLCFCRWIKHHYCAMAMAIISLTWEIEREPNCALKQVLICLTCISLHFHACADFIRKNFKSLLFLVIFWFSLSLTHTHTKSDSLLQKGVHLFLKWAVMQGVAMILQNRYQRQRLYTRIALGKVQ